MQSDINYSTVKIIAFLSVYGLYHNIGLLQVGQEFSYIFYNN